ncbi:MAG: hypothetical protein IJG85_04095 [Eubacteriaceae bacterium]|nr:hypothetical protein [Eubacteriaceae bacterium]
MNRNNFFFKMTGTENKYTEEYLSVVISKILDTEGMMGFGELYEKILEIYPEVKVNRSAVARLAAEEFHVMKRPVNRTKKNRKRNIFFGLQNSDDKHTEEYLIKLISEILDEKPLSKEEIFERVVKKYNGEKINFSAFKLLLDERFQCNGKLYLNNVTADARARSKTTQIESKYQFQQSKYISELNKYALYSNEELYKKYSTVIADDEFNTVDAVVLVLATEIKQGIYSSEKCADICIDVKTNEEIYIDRIRKAVRNVGEENDNIPCSSFVRNDAVQVFLVSENIFCAKDFKLTSPRKILILSAADIGGTILGLESLSSAFTAKIKDTINEVVRNSLNDKEYDVLLRRNGRFTGSSDTLKELGEEYGLTRERVRQIESKAHRKLGSAIIEIKDIIRRYFAFHIKSEELPFKRVKDMLDKEDNDILMNACLTLKFADINYRYDSKYHIIYDSDFISVADIEKEVESRFGKLLAVSRYDSATEFEKEVIDNSYALSGRQHNLYRLKRYNQSDFLIDLIAELFPDGYRIYYDNDYEKLANEYSNRLGDGVEVPSITAVRGIVGRDVFCQIDKGTYKIRKECAEIPIELFNRIFDFIVDHLPAVDYITIYENFEGELRRYGIDNYYYMKGVIDYSLPDDLTTKRNYITETDNRVTAVEARLAFMRSFSGMFTLDDLQNKYPGVKQYVFQCMCYEESKNGLVQIGKKKYIYSDNLSISHEQSTKLKNIIEDLFRNTNEEVLSSRKVFAKTKISYPDLLKNIPYIEDQFSMFSIIKYLFAEDYYFDRPYISKIEPDAERITTRDLILSHLNEYDKIDYNVYRDYCMKMNIQMIYTYMQLVDELSDDYVQIDNRQLIKKEEFNISDNALRDIERVLELIFNRTEKLETTTFNGYMMFPQLKYKWSKHVLAGIIRSYFSEKFKVMNITKGSKSEAVDYEIERYVE